MVASRGRSPSKKDKWKSKKWYNIMAPDMFNRQKVAEALSDEPEKLFGRITEVTVQDITGDFSKMHIKLKFKTNDVRGMDVFTTFIGHDMTSDYVRRMTRRKRTKTDAIVDVYTRDKFLIRIKALVISERRIKSSQQSAIRHLVHQTIQKYASKRSISEVVNGIISGEMGKEAAVACKIIQPLQRVEIRKSEVLSQGIIEHVYEDEHEEKTDDEQEEKAEEELIEPEDEVEAAVEEVVEETEEESEEILEENKDESSTE